MTESFGGTDYTKSQGESGGELYEHTLSLTASQTEQFDLADFPMAEGVIVFVQVIATSGTTDCDVTLHEGTSYDKTDMVFRAESVSVDDDVPTGGYPSSANGLPYEEEDGETKLHVETSENSATDGEILLRIRYIDED